MGWFARFAGQATRDYGDLWRWSVEHLDEFWAAAWRFFELGDGGDVVRADDQMPCGAWFPNAQLNYAARALARTGDGVAVVARSQSRPPRDVTWDELRDLVARGRAGLVRLGVRRGDRVVAYLPNGIEALVAFLASASLGAVWASCPPEFGVRSVVDRFGQLDPVVLLCVRGYRYGGKEIDRRADLDEIVDALPSLRHVVDVDTQWEELLAGIGTLEFEPLPFDHPLYVLFSSGTTGLPKAIVHGHGGVLIEHLKSLALHHDMRPSDRFFWFTTTGWMMWNLLVSGLCAGATIVLFDGNPGWPDLGTLWRLAADTKVTIFGASAPFLMSCRDAGIEPQTYGDLSPIRSIGSTGAPLPPVGFDWVYEQFPDVWLVSVSGGTDVCTAFVGGSPIVPVYRGEISCRYLGIDAQAFDQAGQPVVGKQGELVVRRPMPSMPVGFWGDADGTRYHDAYFSRVPGVWDHGDWVTFTERGTCIITGRSDATLNRGGVRLGTSEFYTVVESMPEVSDSLVVHLEDADRLVLFVQLVDGAALDDGLRARIVAALRGALSPRHAPDEIHAVRAIPRTHSGKKLEVPVKRILLGADPGTVASPGALADPTALAAFVALALDGETDDAAGSGHEHL